MPYKGTHPGTRSGKWLNCLVCKKKFYRLPSQIRRGSVKTCSKTCLGIYFRGKNNPFWGRTHNPTVRRKISQGRKGKLLGNKHAKGYRHTEMARKKIVAASKRLWAEQHDKMLNSLPRGSAHPNYKPKELRAYRLGWSKVQRSQWTDTKCRWCGTTDMLILDHIVPIFLGGDRYRENAQTLCQPCNLFKLTMIELPMMRSLQAKQGTNKGPLSPRASVFNR